MAINKKPTLYRDPATAWFMSQTKAALADMLTEVLRLEQESADEPATAEAAEAKFDRILAMRDGLKSPMMLWREQKQQAQPGA